MVDEQRRRQQPLGSLHGTEHAAAKDPLTRKVYDSYIAFLAGIMDWGEISEAGNRNMRRLA